MAAQDLIDRLLDEATPLRAARLHIAIAARHMPVWRFTGDGAASTRAALDDYAERIDRLERGGCDDRAASDVREAAARVELCARLSHATNAGWLKRMSDALKAMREALDRARPKKRPPRRE